MAVIPNYRHHTADIRDAESVDAVLRTYGSDIKLIIHTAGQPSHDWATERTLDDFAINAVGTMNLLEAARRHCFDATFVSRPPTRSTATSRTRCPWWNSTPVEFHPDHPYHRHGIDESMGLDGTDRTFFGVSKLSADWRPRSTAAPGHEGRRVPCAASPAPPRGRAAARLPVPPGAHSGRRRRVHDLRPRRQAGARQHRRARPRPDVLALPPRPPPRRGLPRRRRPGAQLLGAGGRRQVRGAGGPGDPGELRARGPVRRRQVLDHRHPAVPAALPGLAARARTGRHARI
ncbi:GDP-mannose 4,6-dehydratase, partial [Saccharothrix sp. MB29]|nr:GDP-mannose 4,6-dehydratase [Saccharothrix sp. MB29]